MDERLIAQALQDKARKEIPETMDMFPEIQAQLGRVSLRAARSRTSWLVIAILIMLAASVVAYGAARLLQTVWLDPGLTGASEADLITVLNLEQTHEGVTVVLDYAYADSNRLSIAYHMGGEAPNDIDYQFSGEKIADDQGHEFPNPMFGGGGGGGGGSSDSPTHSYGSSMQGSYDLSTLENLPDKLNMRVEIGVNRLIYPVATVEASATQEAAPANQQPPQTEPLGPFVFEFTVPVIRGQVVEPQQTASANDITLTLNRLSIAPSLARGPICFQPPPSAINYTPLMSLTIDGKAVPMEAEQLLLSPPEGGVPGCYDLQINQSLYNRPGKWRLSIDALSHYLQVGYSSGGNGTTADYSIDGAPDQLALVRARLEPALQAYGIELIESENSLKFSFDLNSDIRQHDIDGLVSASTREEIAGTWVFTFDVPPAK